MQVSTKKEDRRDFLNGLRVRLNVDEQTLSNLEMRMTGKLASAQFLPDSNATCVSTPGLARLPRVLPRGHEPVEEGVCRGIQAEYLNAALIKVNLINQTGLLTLRFD